MSFTKADEIPKEILDGIQVKFRSERSISGYTWDVVKSGLQKYIRRGNTTMALKMVMEMDCFAYKANGERLRTNGLHRLQIIFLEDISLGNLQLWEKLCSWFKELFAERKKTDGEKNREREIELLKLIVINLAESKKIRACDFMKAMTLVKQSEIARIKNYRYPFLDDTVINLKFEEKITKLDEYLKNKNYLSILLLDLVLKEIGKNKLKQFLLDKCLEKYLKYIDYVKQWVKDIGHLKEGFLLYFAPLGEYLYGSDDLQLNERKVEGKWNLADIVYQELDDYVYDRHVYKSQDRTLKYFAEVSSAVFPNAKNVKIPADFEKIFKWSLAGKEEELILEE